MARDAHRPARRAPLGLAALLALPLVTCAGRAPSPVPPASVPALGLASGPYAPMPAYLIASREVGSDVGREWSSPRAVQRLSPVERRERLRALLAAVDAHLVALEQAPSEGERQALRLTVRETRGLLLDYPDAGAEIDELARLVDEMPGKQGRARARARARMGELTDLIRLQLMVSGTPGGR